MKKSFTSGFRAFSSEFVLRITWHSVKCKSLLTVLVILCLGSSAKAVTRTWDNGGGDGLWSNAANWSGNVAPTSADAVVFNGTSTANCAMDVSPTVQSITMAVAYTGVLSLGANTLTLTSALTVNAAAQLDAGTSLVNFSGTVTINSAASLYNLEIIGNGNIIYSQDLTVNNTLTITSVYRMQGGNQIQVSGDVVINDAWDEYASICTVSLRGSTNQTISGSGIASYLDVSKSGGDVLLTDNLELGNSGELSGSGLLKNTGGIVKVVETYKMSFTGSMDELEIAAGANNVVYTQHAVVNNTLTITSVNVMQGGKQIQVSGDVVINDAWDDYATDCTVSLRGSTDQTISGSGMVSYLDVSKSGGDVLLTDNLELGNSGELSGSGLLKNTGGIVKVVGTYTMAFTGSMDDLEIAAGANNVVCTQHAVVKNTLTITSVNVMQGGKQIQVSGDVVINDAWASYATNCTVSLRGSTDQTLTGTGQGSYMEFAKPSGNWIISTSATSFTKVGVIAGLWDLAGSNTSSTSGYTLAGGKIGGTGTLNGAVTANSGGGFAPGSSPGCITINGNLVMNAGSTYTVDINGNTACTDFNQLTVNGTVAINGATLSGATGTAPTAAITIIGNNLTDAVSGTKFSGAAEGSCFAVGGTTYNISYVGGTGNDVTLNLLREITITGNSVDITDGDNTPSVTDDTDFGNANVTGGTVVKTFTIENTGTSNLTISSIVKSGTNQFNFTLGPLTPAGAIASGSSATFNVTFDPSAGGTRTATITVNNNDCDEAVYDFAIQGTGITCTDTDGDGICDEEDNCPNDANGDQADADNDGTGDACDNCPNDPDKIAPGICGCGVSDVDTDGDGTADCNDGCPNDANKIAPGQCGCGVADTDSDGDATADCNDGCPLDANKTAPGICGCGVSDVDTDGDGTADCNDGCPNDANKTAPGQCGCGVADLDDDCDGVANCNDVCPGGDDSVDNNNDNIPDCSQLLAYADYSAAWKCAPNKINVCHNGSTLCISKNALDAHFNHGDNVGPCTGCGEMWSGGGRYKDVNLLDGAIELEIFPNPASDEVIIHLLGQSTSAVLNITDQFGKNILTQPIEPGLTEIVLDLSSGRFPSGAYFVSLLSESHRLTQRLVIAK